MADIADVVIACKRCETPFESGDMITYDPGKKVSLHENSADARVDEAPSSCSAMYYEGRGKISGLENGMYWLNAHEKPLLVELPSKDYLGAANGQNEGTQPGTEPTGEYVRVPGDNKASGDRFHFLNTSREKYFNQLWLNPSNNIWRVIKDFSKPDN